MKGAKSIMILHYTVLWFIMMVAGILMYDQPLITKKKGKVLKALQQIGWMIIFIAMLGFIHGVLALLHLIPHL